MRNNKKKKKSFLFWDANNDTSSNVWQMCLAEVQPTLSGYALIDEKKDEADHHTHENHPKYHK